MTKIVGHGQLPDLRVQFVHLLFVDLGLLRATTLEHPGRALLQRPPPAVDYCGMDAKSVGQFRIHALTLQSLKRNLCLEL